MMYKLKDINKADQNQTELPNGEWVPARGINHKHESIRHRLKLAWWVFTRKADAFTWPEDDYKRLHDDK